MLFYEEYHFLGTSFSCTSSSTFRCNELPHLQVPSVTLSTYQHGVCSCIPLLFDSADGGAISLRNVSELPVTHNVIFEMRN
jgi:hypothetical protein